MTVEVAINGKPPTGRSQRKEGGWYGTRNCLAKSELLIQDEKNFAPGPMRPVRSGLHRHGPKWNGGVQLEIGIQNGQLKWRLSTCRALPTIGHCPPSGMKVFDTSCAGGLVSTTYTCAVWSLKCTR
jgi:hypothetical protein